MKRHIVRLTTADTLSSLTIGNGSFAYTVDVTGMQSFPEEYARGIPLGTEADWGWHSFPNREHYRFEETLRDYHFNGKTIPYTVQIDSPERCRQAVAYFRANPHRLQLGSLGMELLKTDGSPATLNDLKIISQVLDPWTGIIRSSFALEGKRVNVESVANQDCDALSFRIESDLLSEGRLRLRIRFPYPSNAWKDAGNNFREGPGDSIELVQSGNEAIWDRHLDDTRYRLLAAWTGEAKLQIRNRNEYWIVPPIHGTNTWKMSFLFTPEGADHFPPSFEETESSSRQGWKDFWMSGGAVDFSGSTDPRAFELERRVVLSQYLLRVQEAGGLPAQETGLTYNSWYGRPHLEMYWWHEAHNILWGRPQITARSFSWYASIAPVARRIAVRQGFEGVRWPKMTGPRGGEAPSSVGSFLIWQQPHYIYIAEMLYRANPDMSLLEKYKSLVFSTADFMASFAVFDPATGKFNLGKGIIPAQECFHPDSTYNPTYELAYWAWALEIAQQWRKRAGLTPKPEWNRVLSNLAPLAVRDSLYLAAASAADCYLGARYTIDHPAVLAAYATIPAADGLDTAIMRNTFDKVWQVWHWDRTWGWDYPLMAMTATRLYEPDKALEALFMPVQKNTYLPNGHNYQDSRLTIYLPGNGGLLAAVAMMCAGFEGCREANPGFPKNGKWKVRWEGLQKMF